MPLFKAELLKGHAFNRQANACAVRNQIPEAPLSSVVMVITLRLNILVSEGVGWGVRFDSDCEVSGRNVSAKTLHEAEE
jgi:hypothetical protein